MEPCKHICAAGLKRTGMKIFIRDMRFAVDTLMRIG